MARLRQSERDALAYAAEGAALEAMDHFRPLRAGDSPDRVQEMRERVERALTLTNAARVLRGLPRQTAAQAFGYTTDETGISRRQEA